MKDNEFNTFCYGVLETIGKHWLFSENGIIFDKQFNIIKIKEHLSCELQLG